MKGRLLTAITLTILATAVLSIGQTTQQTENTADAEPTKTATAKTENDSPDQSTNSNDASKQADGEDQDRVRIVSADYIKRFRSPIGDTLLKPFRAIAPAVTARITQFEEKREFEYLFGIKTGLPVQPQFGSSRPGSGFGVGLTADSGDFFTEDLKVKASTLVSFSGYVENSAAVEYTPQRVLKDKLKIEFRGFQSIRPREDFYGTGARSSEGDRTTFFHRLYGVRVEGTYRFNPRLRVGAFTEFSRNDITDGKDPKGAAISHVFAKTPLAGLARNIRLQDTGGFVEVDYRDESENPHAGWFSRFTFTNTNEITSHGFGWRNYKVDSRAYLPLGSNLRVLAVRFQGDFNDQNDTGEVPFFRLASLGDDETLRGYDLNRFRGLNSMHVNVEYRFKLMQGFTNEGFKGVEAIMFSDIGQVYDNLSELNWRNVRTTFGGGFQFLTAKRVGLAVLYAKSPEKGRLIFRFGKTF